MTWFLTCFATDDEYAKEMAIMVETFRLHFPDVPCVTSVIDRGQRSWLQMTRFKARWIRNVFVRHSPTLGSLMWLDADARVRRAFSPPSIRDGIAAKRYVQDRISTGTLWIDAGLPVDVLDQWAGYEFGDRRRTEEHSLLSVVEENDVPYQELEDEMTAPCSLTKNGFRGRLWKDAAIIHWNRSRKTLGLVENWPPKEEMRL